MTFPQWQLATFDRETGKVVVQSDIYGSSMRTGALPRRQMAGVRHSL